MVDKDICTEAIQHWGEDYMLNVCAEEPSELIQAISKYRRYGTEAEVESITEEMADVSIILEELKIILEANGYENIDDRVQEWVHKKQLRTMSRMGRLDK